MKAEDLNGTSATWVLTPTQKASSQEASQLVTVKTVFLVLLAVLNILGNSSVCVLVLKDRLLRTTVRNFALASLAVSGLLIIVILIFQILTIFGIGKDSLTACDAFARFFSMLVYVSILHMFILSIDRYIAVFQPLHYRMIVTAKRTTIVLTLVWMIPTLSVGIIPIFMGQEEDFSTRSCFFGCSRFPTHQLHLSLKIHIYLNAMFLFMIPLLIMIVVYAKIAKVSWYQSTRVDPMQGPSVRTGRPRAREMKWAKTIGMVIGAFILCYLPIMVLFLRQVSNGPNTTASEAIAFFAYINAIVSPVIYTLRSRDFRRAFFTICLRHTADVMGQENRRDSIITINGIRRDSEAALSWLQRDESEMSTSTSTSFSFLIQRSKFEEVLSEALRSSAG